MDLLKGTLDVLVLKTLAAGPMHGYAISRLIRATSREALVVEEGALYPALRRMEERGWLRASWGRTDTGREAKFYELTPRGRGELGRAVEAWDRYAAAMGHVLHGDGSS